MNAGTDEIPKGVTADEVDWAVDASSFGFTSTDELEPLDHIVGQPRAVRALEFGLGVRHPGYNIYVAGASGMGKKELIRGALAERVDREATPCDWIYVNNFDEPDRPLALSLAPGEGYQLKEELSELVDRLLEELPRAFRDEKLAREKEQVGDGFQERDQKMLEALDEAAGKQRIKVQITPSGFIMFPLKGEEPISKEEVENLSEAEQKELQERQGAVTERIREFLQKRREMGRELRATLREIDFKVAREVIEPLVDEIAENHRNEELRTWLGVLKAHMVNNWQQFQKQDGAEIEAVVSALEGGAVSGGPLFREYEVNLLVDNRNVEGAPVLVEHAPNYKNLFGVVEHTVERFGREFTDFTMIKAGSLLRANGGYLVLNLVDALMEPVVWKELKRTLKRGSIQIEVYEPLGLFSTSAMKPEPIPLDVKLAVVGDPLVYHLLQLLDEDFAEIFKVKAEFDPDMSLDAGTGMMVGRLLKKLAGEEEGMLAFEAEAVAELLRTGVRLAADKEKLSSEFSRLADLAREASYWASLDGARIVATQYVRQATEESIYRSDLVASKVREWIAQGVLQIRLEGAVVGQVNGLAVADLGDYAFGRPQRVTASVGVGAKGVINIERESKLSGRTYDKGVLILEGYLRHKYSGDHPLALSASLAMEQSYGRIDGDSASAAELVALLSALADLPLRQGIAITGSISQRGEIQAVGGVNEKIEGFFDVCREAGLTGEQGVAIPRANLRHAILRPDVVDAVREGRFHIWTVGHIDQALELLSGRPAGELDQEESIHHAVARRLRKIAGILKEQGSHVERTVEKAENGPERPVDPRPPAPGAGAD